MSEIPAKKKILIIDDEELHLAAVVGGLESADYEATGSTDGRSGIDLVHSFMPDLILCDIMMPDLDGYAVLQTLRMNPATATIPVILMTGLSEKSVMRRGMLLGADDFLLKPFSLDELLEAVNVRFKKQQELSEQTERKMSQLRASIGLALPHEFRTPLHIILGYSRMIEKNSADFSLDEIARMGKAISHAALRLQRVVENFLIFSRLEMMAGESREQEEFRNEKIPHCRKIIERIATERARNSGREQDLHLSLTETPIAIAETYLTKIIEEVIDNAFKFSQKGSPVKVGSAVQDGFFLISVSDAGRGISEEQRQSLGAFIQIERKVYEQQGAGLGMAISKRLTEMAGGKFTVDSIEGKGTEIIIALPVAQIDNFDIN